MACVPLFTIASLRHYLTSNSTQECGAQQLLPCMWNRTNPTPSAWEWNFKPNGIDVIRSEQDT